MASVSFDDVADVFPRELDAEEHPRVEKLIEQSLELIEMEFSRRGRVFGAELNTSSWLGTAVKQAVRVMVSQAVLVGENIGRQSASSTTGPQSDSITWSQGVGIHWGGVGIDDAILDLLGLNAGAMPRGRGGRVVPFGQRRVVRGAEFSERRR